VSIHALAGEQVDVLVNKVAGRSLVTDVRASRSPEQKVQSA
jgi:hypothetical protein